MKNIYFVLLSFLVYWPVLLHFIVRGEVWLNKAHTAKTQIRLKPWQKPEWVKFVIEMSEGSQTSVETTTVFPCFSCPPAETRPLGLLQWLVVLFQHGPGFGRHEAIGRVLSLASHFTHACARDEIVILMAVIKNKTTESVRETHTKRRGALNNRPTSISEKMPINGTANTSLHAQQSQLLFYNQLDQGAGQLTFLQTKMKLLWHSLMTHPTLWNLTWWLFAYENIFMNDISYADHFSQHDIPAKSLCGRRDNVTQSGKHQHATAVVAGKGGRCSWLSTCCAVIYAPVLCCCLPHDSCCCKPQGNERICISLILVLNWKKAAMLGKLCNKYQHIITFWVNVQLLDNSSNWETVAFIWSHVCVRLAYCVHRLDDLIFAAKPVTVKTVVFYSQRAPYETRENE